MSSIKSRIASQYDYYHFIVFGIVLLGLSVKFILITFLLVTYLTFLFLKKRDTFWALVVVLLIFLCHFAIKEVNYYLFNRSENTGFVLKVSKLDHSYKCLVGLKSAKCIVYTSEALQEGDYLSFVGEKNQYFQHYLFGFDYQSYLHFQNIVGVYSASSIEKSNHSFTPYFLHEAVNSYLTSHFDGIARSYLKVFITGASDELDKEEINTLGISHLFVISGLHVSMLLAIIKRIAKWLKISEKVTIIISLTFLGTYLFLTAFLVSVLRVVVGYVLKLVLKTSTLDLISMNLILVVLINPYYLWQASFILSYAIAFFLCLYQPFNICKIKILNKAINLWILTFFIQLFTLPITTGFNPDFNLFSIIVNPFYILVVSYVILPLSIITCLIYPIGPLYGQIASIFQKSVENLANFKSLLIPLGNINIYFKLFYYGVFFITLRGIYTKKYYYLATIPLILGLWFGKGIFQLETKIAFLDMKTGDACLITTPHKRTTIVIDTSDATKNNELSTILKNEGVRHIDYLILTHHDSDHAGGAKMLMEDLKTKVLITSFYEKEKFKYLEAYCQESYYLKAPDSLQASEITLNALSPTRDYGNPNDNSLVFILLVDGIRLLNTGDASIRVERDLSSKRINVDLYKVAHHGSDTSSSISFLKQINYQYAVIMNGYGNQFGFPKEEVVKRFDERLLITRDYQTIYFRVKKGKIKWIRPSRVRKMLW